MNFKQPQGPNSPCGNIVRWSVLDRAHPLDLVVEVDHDKDKDVKKNHQEQPQVPIHLVSKTPTHPGCAAYDGQADPNVILGPPGNKPGGTAGADCSLWMSGAVNK